MRSSTTRGHTINFVEGKWVYKDTFKPTEDTDRCYRYCQKMYTTEGHDGCLGTLLGVTNACCGYGVSNDAFIQYRGGREVRGDAAVDDFRKKYNLIFK